jgi:hypothetical protein
MGVARRSLVADRIAQQNEPHVYLPVLVEPTTSKCS